LIIHTSVLKFFIGLNQLEKCQPTLTNTLDVIQQQQQLIPTTTTSTTNLQQEYNMSIESFLNFAIQCCNCLEMIHKQQSKHLHILSLIVLLTKL
jgi:hypothetical protein